MNARGKPVRNERRSRPSQRRSQNLLEVTVRSRQANKQRNRRILLWACKLILAVGVVGGSIYGVREGLRRFLWENPEYNLAVVEINDESAGVSRETVLTTAGLRIGQNIFGISLAKAREAVAALPQVEHVEFQRVLPNKITVDLTERHPVAWLADSQAEDPTTSAKSFLIDSRGALFKPKRQLPEYLRLPAIYGVATENFLSGEIVDTPEVRAALDLVQQNSDTNSFQLQSIDLSQGYCMVVTNAKRAKITFGIDNISRQLERLGAVLDYVASSHREIQTVNLMVERNIPVTFAPPPGQEQGTPEAPAAPVAEKSANTAEKVPEKSTGKTAPKSAKAAKSAPSTSRRKTSSETRAKTSRKRTAPPELTIRRALPVHPDSVEASTATPR